jgi:uncharacterized protein (TIGR02246 family)
MKKLVVLLVVTLGAPALHAADRTKQKLEAAERRAAIQEIESNLRRYNNLVLLMDHAGIAELFAEDGVLVGPKGPIVGPKAIKEFLESFKDYRVKANKTTPIATSVYGAHAKQTGTYWQRVQLPSKETVEVSGKFEASWVRRQGQWLIEKMSTTPDPPSAKR